MEDLTPEERLEFLANKRARSPEEQTELIFASWKHLESLAEKMNVELEEKWKTPENKQRRWKNCCEIRPEKNGYTISAGIPMMVDALSGIHRQITFPARRAILPQ